MADNLYLTDLTDAAWALVAPLLPPAGTGGRPRTTDVRAVLDAIFHLLRTGCQWHRVSLLPKLEEHGRVDLRPASDLRVLTRTQFSRFCCRWNWRMLASLWNGRLRGSDATVE